MNAETKTRPLLGLHFGNVLGDALRPQRGPACRLGPVHLNWPFIAIAIPADAAPNLVALVELPGGHCSILGTPTCLLVGSSGCGGTYSVSTRRSVSCNDTRVGKGSERLPGPRGWTHRRVGNSSPPA
jgi:hypothetical protein